MMTLLRLRQLAFGVALGLGLGLALAVLVPAGMGWRTLTVMSGSMSPAIHTGDAVVTRPVAPESIRPGDVVTFRDPEGTDRLITHRVRSAWVSGSAVEVVTKGDANTSTERWQVPRGGTVGRVVYRLPRVGYVLVPAASPLGRLLLMAAPTLILGILGILAIWRPQRKEKTGSPVAAPVVLGMTPPTVLLPEVAYPLRTVRPPGWPMAALPPAHDRP